MTNRALLLANLGSPDEPNAESVRQYLDQFLMDPDVIQLPWLFRRLIVSLFVLPKRPKQSAKAYQSIWTEEGSPLVVFSEKLRQAVQDKLKSEQINIPVFMSMRYGNPSIASQILEISKNKSIKRILFAPLYPHFADSTFKTSVKEAEKTIRKNHLQLELELNPVFYNSSQYIDALIKSSSDYLFDSASASNKHEQSPHLLFSYHGLPEIHLKKADPTKKHCLKTPNCCSRQSIAHKTCYKHQVLETTRLYTERLGLTSEQYSVSFQSRLGKAKWLEPSTEETIIQLAKRGVKDLVVICPAFVTDCLETLEEIAMQGREIFIKSGGNSLKLIPCLNTHPDWINVVASWVK